MSELFWPTRPGTKTLPCTHCQAPRDSVYAFCESCHASLPANLRSSLESAWRGRNEGGTIYYTSWVWDCLEYLRDTTPVLDVAGRERIKPL